MPSGSRKSQDAMEVDAIEKKGGTTGKGKGKDKDKKGTYGKTGSSNDIPVRFEGIAATQQRQMGTYDIAMLEGGRRRIHANTATRSSRDQPQRHIQQRPQG